MAWQWYQSTITEIRNLTHNTRLFILKVDSEEPFLFKAGQFITIDLPIGVKKRDGWRSYSIANGPNTNNILELAIVRFEDGKGTEYLFDKVNVGDELTFKGPSGNFVLPEESNKHLVMICTGTGIAPFRSMWQDLATENHSLHVIFGTRTLQDALFEEEMRELSAKHEGFSYDICLSREEKEGYHKGYVHQVYLDQYKDPTENSLFYLCGWSEMVNQGVAHLFNDLKKDRKQIIYELYG